MTPEQMGDAMGRAQVQFMITHYPHWCAIFPMKKELEEVLIDFSLQWTFSQLPQLTVEQAEQFAPIFWNKLQEDCNRVRRNVGR